MFCSKRRFPPKTPLSLWMMPGWGIEVVSILELPYAGEPFPGYGRINHTRGVLDVAVKQDWHDWRGALQHMKGFDVIHTPGRPTWVRPAAIPASGRACVTTSIHYTRATSLCVSGRFRKGLTTRARTSTSRSSNVGPVRSADDEDQARESYWKDMLLTRHFGLNRN